VHAGPKDSWPGDALQHWADCGLRWGEASQELVRSAGDLALASRDLATLVAEPGPDHPPVPGLTGAERSRLAQDLILLAPTVERQAATQRDDYLAIAPALAELRSLWD
jgi:hypothetical protein